MESRLFHTTSVKRIQLVQYMLVDKSGLFVSGCENGAVSKPFVVFFVAARWRETCMAVTPHVREDPIDEHRYCSLFRHAQVRGKFNRMRVKRKNIRQRSASKPQKPSGMRSIFPTR